MRSRQTGGDVILASSNGWLTLGGSDARLVYGIALDDFAPGAIRRSGAYAGPHWRAVPLQPLWIGFIFNTLWYAVAAGLLLVAPGVIRRWSRRRRHCCPACGYPTGTSPVCTECGAALRVLVVAAIAAKSQ